MNIFVSRIRKIFSTLPGYGRTAHIYNCIYIYTSFDVQTSKESEYWSENTAMPMLLVVRQKWTYGNMADSELLCVEVATLLRNDYARIRVISQGCICSQKLRFFLFYSRYLPSLLLPRRKKGEKKMILLWPLPWYGQAEEETQYPLVM